MGPRSAKPELPRKPGGVSNSGTPSPQPQQRRDRAREHPGASGGHSSRGGTTPDDSKKSRRRPRSKSPDARAVEGREAWPGENPIPQEDGRRGREDGRKKRTQAWSLIQNGDRSEGVQKRCDGRLRLEGVRRVGSSMNDSGFTAINAFISNKAAAFTTTLKAMSTSSPATSCSQMDRTPRAR